MEEQPTEQRPLLFSTDRFFMHNWHVRAQEDVPLEVARQAADLVAEACKIVHDPKHLFLGDPDAPAFTDEVVAEVMRGLQAQLDREGESRTRGSPCGKCKVPHTHYYRLAQDLPPARQRALAERLWRVWKDWGGQVRVFREGDAPPTSPTPTAVPYAEGWFDYGLYG